MTRKMLIVAISTLALTFGALALSYTADAQTACNYADRIAGRCNNSIAGPTGGLTAPGSGASGANATAGTTTTTATTGASNPNAESTIAFTGAESAVLGYIGAGMIGLGSVALVARRRMGEVNED